MQTTVATGGASADPDARHNFTHKLGQRSVWPRVVKYILWQAVSLKAHAEGQEVLPMPRSVSPVSINLDPTTACTYACPHCIDAEMLNQGYYDHARLIASLETLIEGGLRSVILIGGGEPTVYPKFVELVTFLKERGISVGIVSNGSRPKILRKIFPLLKGEDRDWLRLSLDNSTDEGFLRAHKPIGKNPITLSEICSEVRDFAPSNPDVPVWFSFIIMPGGWQIGKEGIVRVHPNLGEIAGAARLARSSGFKYITYKLYLTRDEDDGSEGLVISNELESAESLIRSELDEAGSLADGGFTVVHNSGLRAFLAGEVPELKRQPEVCHKIPLQQVLTPGKVSGGIYNCPAHRAVPEARIADATSYAEGLSGMQEATALHQRGFDASVKCANTACLYNGMNWELEGLIQKVLAGELTEKQLLSMAVDDYGDYFL